MNLDQKKIPHRNGYFTGKYRSVLSTIANNNDYELTNGYSSEYFGQKGGHLTAYNLGDQTLKDSSLCVAAGDGLVSLRIYGVCKIFGEFFGLAHFAGYGTFTKDWAEKVLGIISSLSEKEGPQITFHYIYNPIGHSPLSYSHGNQQQRADYLKQFSVRSKRAADVMKELVDIIKKQDPKALVLIFGDHGAWLSRGVKYKEDSQFFMKDRHMIELAVLKTEHKCAESDQVFRYASAYATPSRVLAGMLRCLAEDPLVMDKLVDFGDRIDECDDSDAHQLKLVSEDIEQSSKCFYAP